MSAYSPYMVSLFGTKSTPLVLSWTPLSVCRNSTYWSICRRTGGALQCLPLLHIWTKSTPVLLLSLTYLDVRRNSTNWSICLRRFCTPDSNVCLSSIYGLCLLAWDKKYPTTTSKLNSPWRKVYAAIGSIGSMYMYHVFPNEQKIAYYKRLDMSIIKVNWRSLHWAMK